MPRMVSEAMRSVSLPAALRRRRLDRLLLPGAVGAIAYLVLVPLVYLVWRTFFEAGRPTLRLFRDAYAAHGLGGMAANSLVFGAGATVLAVALGTALAYLIVRTDVPFKAPLFALVLVPLLVPGVLYTISWIFLASPRSGLLNRVLEPVFGAGALDIFSMTGMIIVEGLHLTPLVFLLIAAALRSLDPALEESALVSAAPMRAVFRRVTLPLLRPALLAAAFIVLIRALEGFEVPALLGVPAGEWVFTSRIWRALSSYPADFGKAGAYSVALLVITGAGVYLLARLAPRSRAFETLTGRGARPRPLPLGTWRWPAAAAISVHVVLAVVLPLLMLVYVSTQPYYSSPSLESLSGTTFAHYSDALTHEGTLTALRNSVLVCAGAATTVVVLAALAGWLVVRTRVRGRWLVDALASLPIAVPGVVLGAALLIVYLRVPIAIYGTLWILFIAYLTRYLPYGMRYVSVSMTQISRELEESAEVSGATWWQTFRRIVLPLAAPGLIAGWLFIVAVSLRELSSSLLLYSPGNEVLSVRIWQLYQSGQLPELAALGVLMMAGLTVLTALAFQVWRRVGVAPRPS
jgi:iron(III) transport system permease protein